MVAERLFAGRWNEMRPRYLDRLGIDRFDVPVISFLLACALGAFVVCGCSIPLPVPPTPEPVVVVVPATMPPLLPPHLQPLLTKLGTSLAGVFSALVLLAAPGSMAGAQEKHDELGRLFFTPERRQMLDRQRQLNIQEKQEIPEDPTLTINGVVARSSGKRTAWINGVPQNENETPSGVSVIPKRKEPGKVVVQTSESPAGNARVGDTVNRNTGEATDLLGGGRINIRSTVAK